MSGVEARESSIFICSAFANLGMIYMKVKSRTVCTVANCVLNYQLMNKVALKGWATGGFR
jgi:hypothetical protein